MLTFIALFMASIISPDDAARIEYSKQSFVYLDVGESHNFKLNNGSERKIVLKSVNEHPDKVMDLMRSAEIVVEIDGRPVRLVCEPYVMPIKVDGLFIVADTTDRWMELPKKVQLSLWDASDAIVDTERFSFPLTGYGMFSQGMQAYNEPVHLGHRDGDPKGQRFYHNYGFDLAGFEGRDQVVSCIDGTVTHVGREMGTLVFEDANGIVFEYGHMDEIFPEIEEGMKIKRGRKVGVLGRKGASGNFSHLHVGMYLSVDDFSEGRHCRNMNLYPWLLTAFQAASGQSLFAVARPHRAVLTGEIVKFDGTKSVTFGKPVKSFRWEFHDGTVKNEPEAEMVYDKPGTYMATLWIEDAEGVRDVDFCKVKVYTRDQVEDVMPIIYLTQAPTRGVRRGQPVYFRAWPHGEEMDGIRLDFGDGTVVKDYEPYSEVKHGFEKAGIHVVTASAEWNGRSVTQKIKVIVQE